MKSVYREIDALVNRVSEGLRVVEDLARFVFEVHPALIEELKRIRHDLRKFFPADRLFAFRDVDADPKKEPELIEAKTSIKSVVISNFKRVEESLRSLEEIWDINLKSLRFRVYALEKEFLKVFPRLGPIYLITQRTLRPDLDDDAYISFIENLVKTGYIDVVQVREKGLPGEFRKKMALLLRESCREHECTLIVNDDPFLAMEVEADGVHLGYEDYPVSGVRSVFSRFYPIGVVGYSPEDEDDILRKKQFCDYLGVGDVFGTSTKPDAGRPIGIEGLKKRVELAGEVPVFAVGGITPENFKAVLEAGAYGAAFCSAVLNSSNPERTLESFIKALTYVKY